MAAVTTSPKMAEIKAYRPAKLYIGKRWYIGYYVYNPQTKKLERKAIKINHIDSVPERRRYANELIKRLNNNLTDGWNPFTEQTTNNSFKILTEAIEHFVKIYTKKFDVGEIRKETIDGYRSYAKNLLKYLSERNLNLYVYQFDKVFCTKFIDYIYYDLGRSGQTRDNYLIFLRVLSNFMVSYGYITVKPTDGMTTVAKKRKGTKNRTVIPPDVRTKILKYLKQHNPHFLLSCFVLYYCFIRPREMSYLKISDINFKMKTIFISGTISKNKKDDHVTITEPLMKLMLDLQIHKYPSDYYMFSENFAPGKKQVSSKNFRDYWGSLRKHLDFPDTYKFYSLKDTGITDLFGIVRNPVLVRDQARHYSIEMTDTYTPHGLTEANPVIAANNNKF